MTALMSGRPSRRPAVLSIMRPTAQHQHASSRAVATLALFPWTPRPSISSRLFTSLDSGRVPLAAGSRLALGQVLRCGLLLRSATRPRREPFSGAVAGLVMPPCLALSPLECSEGVSLSQAANDLALNLENSAGLEHVGGRHGVGRPSGSAESRPPLLPSGLDALCLDQPPASSLSSIACLTAST